MQDTGRTPQEIEGDERADALGDAMIGALRRTMTRQTYGHAEPYLGDMYREYVRAGAEHLVQGMSYLERHTQIAEAAQRATTARRTLDMDGYRRHLRAIGSLALAGLIEAGEIVEKVTPSPDVDGLESPEEGAGAALPSLAEQE